jgi:hypothetical protein
VQSLTTAAAAASHREGELNTSVRNQEEQVIAWQRTLADAAAAARKKDDEITYLRGKVVALTVDLEKEKDVANDAILSRPLNGGNDKDGNPKTLCNVTAHEKSEKDNGFAAVVFRSMFRRYKQLYERAKARQYFDDDVELNDVVLANDPLTEQHEHARLMRECKRRVQVRISASAL